MGQCLCKKRICQNDDCENIVEIRKKKYCSDHCCFWEGCKREADVPLIAFSQKNLEKYNPNITKIYCRLHCCGASGCLEKAMALYTHACSAHRCIFDGGWGRCGEYKDASSDRYCVTHCDPNRRKPKPQPAPEPTRDAIPLHTLSTRYQNRGCGDGSNLIGGLVGVVASGLTVTPFL